MKNKPIPLGKGIAHLLFNEGCMQYWNTAKVPDRWPDAYVVTRISLFPSGAAALSTDFAPEFKTHGETCDQAEFEKALREAFRRLGISGEPKFDPFSDIA